MPTIRLSALLLIVALAVIPTANAHLFSPASKTDKEYLEALYTTLGVIPPRYDLTSRQLQPKDWQLFNQVFENGGSQVGRYAIPLLATALRWNQPPSDETTKALAEALRHFIDHHKRIAREHDSDVALAQWLLTYHQTPAAEQTTTLIVAMESSSAIRSTALALLVDNGDESTLAALSLKQHDAKNAKLKQRYQLASRRLNFKLDLAQQPPTESSKMLSQALSGFLRHSVHDLGLNRSDFEWLLSLTSLGKHPSRQALLATLSQSPQLTPAWRSIAKRYLALWQSRF